MKRIFKNLVLVIIVIYFSICTVFAAPSISNIGAVKEEVIINGVVDPSLSLKKIKISENPFIGEDDQNAIAAITTVNNEPEKITELLKEEKIQNTANVNLNKVKLLTKFTDLSIFKDGQVFQSNAPVTVSFEVPNLVSGIGEVYVLHYSLVRNVFELLEPDDVDFTTKSITATFPDLSPVAVVYVPANSGLDTEDNKDTANDTGDDTNYSIYLAIAAGVVVLGAAYIINFKRK